MCPNMISHTMKLIYFLLVFVFIRVYNINGRVTTSTMTAKDIGDIVATAGERAEIPCPSKPRKSDDEPNLILWYKDSLHKPIYSYDARVSAYAHGERWANRSLLGDRAFFVPLSKPFATLVLEPVISTDEGSYSCRLDYFDSPTMTTKSNLTVIVKPSPPEIYWNNEHVAGPIGPIKEGTTSKLTCVTSGGRPQPSLTWWMEESMIIANSMVKDGKVRAILTIAATREINMKSYSCHTQSLHNGIAVAEPLTATVMFDIMLPPVSLRIDGGNVPAVADATVTLRCTAWGSNPPATIEWWNSGKLIKPFANSINDGGNSSVAEIKIIVSSYDHGSTYLCRASNPSYTALPLEERVTLNVTYKPKVELRVKVSNEAISDDSLPNHFVVKKRSHIQMECPVQANPPAQYIEWIHNGIIVSSGPNAFSFLLQQVTKKNSGTYSCAATNNNGKGISHSYDITVEFTPECTIGWRKRTQGAEIGRSATVLCHVNALPSNDLTFYWTKLNRKGKEKNFRTSQIHSDGSTSRLTFIPKNLTDFGTLICRAKNSVGLQQEGCHVNLVPASAPDAPFNCSTKPGTIGGSILISCMEGFDGGFPQSFSLVAIQNAKLIAKIDRNFPDWVVKNLETGKSVTLRIDASNARGKSNTVRLEAYVHVPQFLADQGMNGQSPSYSDRRAPLPVIGILVGIGGALGISAFGFIIYFLASDNCQVPEAENNQRHFKSTSTPSNTWKDEMETIPLRRVKTSDPDIVTCVKPDTSTSSTRNIEVPVPYSSTKNNLAPNHCRLSSVSCSTSSDHGECLFDYSQREAGNPKNQDIENLYVQTLQLQRSGSHGSKIDIYNNATPKIYCERKEIKFTCPNDTNTYSSNDNTNDISCSQCQEYNASPTPEANDPMAIYAIIPYNSCSANYCKSCESNDTYQYCLRSPNSNTCRRNRKFRDYPMTKENRNLEFKSTNYTDAIYEDSKLLCRPANNYSRNKCQEKPRIKGWQNRCGSFICSANNQTDSLEDMEKIRRGSGTIDDDQFSTYQKFDGVYPYELSLDDHSESPPIPLTNQNSLSKYESAEQEILDEKTKRQQEKKEFDDLLYISKTEMDNLLRIDNRSQTHNILDYSKPINDLIQKDERIFDRVVSPTRNSSFRLKELGNSSLYRKREEIKKGSLKKQASLSNVTSARKLSIVDRPSIRSRERSNKTKFPLVSSKNLKSSSQSSRRHSTIVTSKALVKPTRKISTDPILKMSASLPCSPINIEPSNIRAESAIYKHNKTDDKECSNLLFSNISSRKIDDLHEFNSNSEPLECPPVTLKSILRKT